MNRNTGCRALADSPSAPSIRGWPAGGEQALRLSAVVLACNVLLTGHSVAASDSASHGSLFLRLDGNGDGLLSAAEVPANQQRLFARLLRLADNDRSGQLDAAEFDRGMAPDGPSRTLEQASPARRDPAQLRRIFARLDRNGDSQVKPSEVPEEFQPRFRQWLAQLDRNGDGVLGMREVEAALSAGKPPEPTATATAAAAALFARIDRDGDGEITSDEVPRDRQEQFHRLLDVADGDTNGGLTREEFARGWTLFQQRNSVDSPPPSATDRLWSILDQDGDGTLSASEIAAAQQQLSTLDRNGDGQLSRTEMARSDD